MRIKVKEIGDEGFALRFPVTASWLATECPDLDVRPGLAGVALEGRVSRVGDDFLLRGQISGAFEATCARCLERARVPLAIPVAVTFVERAAGEASGDARDAADDDTDATLFDGDEIDVGAEVREQILLTLPVSPLCAEDCAGLCSVCGGNRNQIACDCQARQRVAVTPLASLGKLKV